MNQPSFAARRPVQRLRTVDQRSRVGWFSSSRANSIRHAVTQNSCDLAARSRQIFACARWTAAASGDQGPVGRFLCITSASVR